MPRNSTYSQYYMQVRAFVESKVFNVDELLSSQTLPHRNQWWWYSISGSDDLAWAALALFEAMSLDRAQRNTYLNYTTGDNYEKGILQILAKMDGVFRDADGFIYWGLTRDVYYAMISTT